MPQAAARPRTSPARKARSCPSCMTRKRPGRPPSILLDKVKETVIAALEELPGDATHWSRSWVVRRTLGRAGHDRFPQIRAIGVQVGFRSRNSNDSAEATPNQGDL